MAVSSIGTSIRRLWPKNALQRGMLSYSLIWPTSVVIQETVISGKSFDEIDWAKCVRFSLFGALYVAPTLYTWVRLTSALWPRTALKTGIIKAITEQITYTPFAMTSFYFGMSLLEGRSVAEASDEVCAKFWPTYQVAVCVWPAVATFNYTLVPDRNRVPFVSVCSLLWTCFLAWMKQREADNATTNVTAISMATTS